MEFDMNPYRELPANITPIDFELFCMETIKAYAEKENLSNYTIKHNQKVETHDSTYQIDVLVEYMLLGCKHTIVVECKKHSNSIKRSVVTDLQTKIQSMGAQKGIIISTAGFQTDAAKFANEHGIALWQICDRSIKHISMSANPSILQHMLFQFETEKYLPKYIMMEWDCAADFPYHELYPTQEMYSAAFEAASKDLRQRRTYDDHHSL